MPEKAKKVFDVAPPQPPGSAILQIENRRRVMIDDVQDKNTMPAASANAPRPVIKPIEAELVPSHTDSAESHDVVQQVGSTMPVSEPASHAESVDAQAKANKSDTETDARQAEQPSPESETHEHVDDSEPQKTEETTSAPEQHLAAPGVVSDAIPDVSQKLTAEAEVNMQQPKAFDTNEYFVPIGETVHKHGHLRESLIFGGILAAIVVAAVVFLLGQ